MAEVRKKSLAKRYLAWRKEAKGDAGRAAGVTLADTALSVIGGGVAGGFLGPLGVVAGLATAYYGHYNGSEMATMLGTSMVAGGLFGPQSTRPAPQGGDTFDKLEHQFQMAGDRVKLMLGAASDKFSLSPAGPQVAETENTASLLEQAVEGLSATPSLDEIEAQIERSALERGAMFQENSEMHTSEELPTAEHLSGTIDFREQDELLTYM